ncbi:acyl carrier protein [Robbsia sp. Bb-Pol-6]|uniref:Acyl carrier protein n=1 Tax=Robbsia betulipollinis TaxID=2981849 RepID=A0ABT3ZSQ6_9BURK|nr:acyl carrier protein [Robbsia betulipollinis]MCY0388970.1 acyl carrier protein [Robbsia betulipollinis]
MPMHSASMIESEVTKWLNDNRGTDSASIKGKNLIEDRILDSMQFLDFIMFLGEIAGHDVSTTVKVEDLRTIDSVVSFVQTHQDATSSAVR